MYSCMLLLLFLIVIRVHLLPSFLIFLYKIFYVIGGANLLTEVRDYSIALYIL